MRQFRLLAPVIPTKAGTAGRKHHARRIHEPKNTPPGQKGAGLLCHRFHKAPHPESGMTASNGPTR